MFSHEEVRRALANPQLGIGGRVAVSIFDASTRIGVGRSSSGAYVLLLPGQPAVDTIAGRHVEFRPWVSVEVSSGETVSDCALVICEYVSAADSEVAALAVIFEALIQLALHSDDESAAGRAVHSLFTLFENRLSLTVSDTTEIGLIGELLVIASSTDPRSLVNSWHVDPNDRYDFSIDSERLEVKTTIGSERVHHFSGTQLPPSLGLTLEVVSIQCDRVAQGTGLSDLFVEICEQLHDETFSAAFRTKCIEVLGADPRMVRNVQIDRARAEQAMILLDERTIPTPTSVEGVRALSWSAAILNPGLSSANTQLARWAGLPRSAG